MPRTNTRAAHSGNQQKMECGVCSETTGQSVYLCGRHIRELESHLANIPDVWVTLRDTISLQATTPGGPGGAAGTKPPINLHALDIAETLTAVLKGWGEQFTDVAGLTTPQTAARLHQHRALLPRWELAGEFLLELRDALVDAVHATDRGLERIEYGHCRCGGIIRGTAGARTAHCRECRDQYDVAGLQAWRASRAWGVTAPLPDILRALSKAGYANLNIKKVRAWVYAGKLTAELCDVETRRELFTPGAVLYAYRQTPAGRKSTTRQTQAA